MKVSMNPGSVGTRCDSGSLTWLVCIPSTALQPNCLMAFSTSLDTSVVIAPGFSNLIAASAPVKAALIASAAGPSAGLLLSAPTTMVSALMAGKPSMCAPSWILTTSPSLRAVLAASELGRGALLQMMLLMEIVVGKADPCMGDEEKQVSWCRSAKRIVVSSLAPLSLTFCSFLSDL